MTRTTKVLQNWVGRPHLRLLLAAPLLVAGVSGCASSRYVGALSGGASYVNRGYGVVLPFSAISARWWIFDPEHPDKGPAALAPERKEDRIDIDGDGMLRLDELTARYEPALRLLSRTSTAPVRIELQVEILSEPGASEVSHRGLFDSEVRSRAGTPQAMQIAISRAEKRVVSMDRQAWVTSIVGTKGGGAERLALVDQPDLSAEEDITRRQVVWLRLIGPTLRPQDVKDFDTLLSSLLAAREVGALTRHERW